MPKVVDSEERRQEIVSAAYRILAREGLVGLSMRKLAKESGATIGLLNHWFSSKHEILEAALDLAIENELQQRHLSSEVSFAALEASLQSFLPITESAKADLKVWQAFEELAEEDPQLQKKVVKKYDHLRELLMEKVALLLEIECKTSGTDFLVGDGDKEQREPTVEDVADLLIATIDGISWQFTTDPERWHAERQKRVLHLALRNALDAS